MPKAKRAKTGRRPRRGLAREKTRKFRPTDFFSKRGRGIPARGSNIFNWLERAQRLQRERPDAINATIGQLQVRDTKTGGMMPHSFGILDQALVDQGILKGVRATRGADVKVINVRHVVPYSPIGGIPDFLVKWKGWVLHGSSNNAKEKRKLDRMTSGVVPAIGITHALTQGLYLFHDPGEEIVVPNPGWEAYKGLIKQSGLKMRGSTPIFDRNKEFNIDGITGSLVRSLSGEAKKVGVIINFPHNPTGFVPSREEVDRLAEGIDTVAERFPKKMMVVYLDKAYYDLIHSKDTKPIMGALLKRPNVLVVSLDAITKGGSAYGMRVGTLMMGHVNMTKRASELFQRRGRVLLRRTISNIPRAGQELVIEAGATWRNLRGYMEENKQVRGILSERYRVLMNAIEKTRSKLPKEIRDDVVPVHANPGGGFFTLLSTGRFNAGRIAERLSNPTARVPVSLVPGENRKSIRIAYSGVDKEDIPRLVNALYLAVRKEAKSVGFIKSVKRAPKQMPKE